MGRTGPEQSAKPPGRRGNAVRTRGQSASGKEPRCLPRQRAAARLLSTERGGWKRQSKSWRESGPRLSMPLGPAAALGGRQEAGGRKSLDLGAGSRSGREWGRAPPGSCGGEHIPVAVPVPVGNSGVNLRTQHQSHSRFQNRSCMLATE